MDVKSLLSFLFGGDDATKDAADRGKYSSRMSQNVGRQYSDRVGTLDYREAMRTPQEYELDAQTRDIPYPHDWVPPIMMDSLFGKKRFLFSPGNREAVRLGLREYGIPDPSDIFYNPEMNAARRRK